MGISFRSKGSQGLAEPQQHQTYARLHNMTRTMSACLSKAVLRCQNAMRPLHDGTRLQLSLFSALDGAVCSHACLCCSTMLHKCVQPSGMLQLNRFYMGDATGVD